MSIHKFTTLINIKLNDMQSAISGIQSTFDDKLETFINEFKHQYTELRTGGTWGVSRALRVEEIQFNIGETNIIINAKLLLDINKSIEDIRISLKYLEHEIKDKLLEKEKEINLDAAKLVEEQQVILRNHLERNLILELEKKLKASSQRYY